MLIGITGCESKKLILDEDGVLELGDNFKISTKEIAECEHEVKEYYSKDDQKVNFVCLDKVNLNIDNKVRF